MKYARSPHMLTVHLADDDTPTAGRVLCGKTPPRSQWYRGETHEWEFSDQLPQPNVACKACYRVANKRGLAHREAIR